MIIVLTVAGDMMKMATNYQMDRKEMMTMIGEITKTKRVKTVVRINDYKGRTLIDIRDFFLPDNSSEFVPTKKGISIDKSNLSSIIDLLEKAEQSLSK
jgi:hypothetical protein